MHDGDHEIRFPSIGVRLGHVDATGPLQCLLALGYIVNAIKTQKVITVTAEYILSCHI